MIELISAPFDKGGKRRGSLLCSQALRLAGIVPSLSAVLAERGMSLAADVVEVPSREVASPADGLHDFCEAFQTYSDLKIAVTKSLESGATPLVMGGSHDISIGSISGALQHFSGDLAVIWIDAHADMNTPDTSPSGNLHGMPVAALAGLEVGGPVSRSAADQWQSILDLVPAKRLDSDHFCWLGLRDVDPGEIHNMKRLPGCRPYTMQDIDKLGIPAVLSQVDSWLRGLDVKNVWISFDVDSLDPVLAPGTGTMVRGGFSYRESHLMAELFFDLFSATDCPYRLAGLDIVEVNPLIDTHNETAAVGVEWLCSLFGKSILRGWKPLAGV